MPKVPACPYGAVARLAEWLKFHAKTPRERWTGIAILVGICTLLSAITFSFWIDWRVFREGSSLAIALSAAFLLACLWTHAAAVVPEKFKAVHFSRAPGGEPTAEFTRRLQEMFAAKPR